MGTVYRSEKFCLMISTTDTSFGTVPQFGLLYDIVIQGSSQELHVYFMYLVMNTLNYDRILGAYVVKKLQDYRCVHRSIISNGCYHLFNAVQHNGNCILSPNMTSPSTSIVTTEHA